MTEQSNSRRRNRKNKKKIKSRRKIIFQRIILSLLGIFALIAISVAILFAYWMSQAPPLNEARLKNATASTIIDMNGNEYAKLGSESRDYVAYDDIPKKVEDALLATEDNRFYKHKGIDVIRLAGAIFSNITTGSAQGGSTLTQQVIKMSHLSPDKTTKRKVQEWYLAYQLEQKFTKQQILEIYVNKINMSQGAYGIGTAAKAYFNKKLNELTLPEIAYLVGLPQSPNNYNAFNHPEAANKRKNTVLYLMKNAEKISEKEMKDAQNVDIATLLNSPNQENKTRRTTNAIIDEVINEVNQSGDYNLLTDGLKIYTTIDPDAQQYVESILEGSEVIKYPDDSIQSGITLLDTKTGAVRAIGGWRKQTIERGFNYATALKTRQPGSTIKPILDYGPAIEYNGWSTYEQIVDEPYQYSNGTKVRNATNKYAGQISMRTALEKSINITAVKALQAVGIEKAHAFSKGLGINLDDPLMESAAIGAVKNGPSPFQMAGAYATFGNNGIYNKPHTVTKIVTQKGETKELAPKPKKAMEPFTAYMITDMLKGVPIRGTGTRGYVNGLPMAAKTGTTNYTDEEKVEWKIPDKAVPDSWYIGYTTDYTLAVWTGYSNYKTPVSSEAQRIPAITFKAIMSYMTAQKTPADFNMPDSVVKLPIIAGSKPAKIAPEGTSEQSIVYELFLKDKMPESKTQEPPVTEPVEPPISEEPVKTDNYITISNISSKYDQTKKTVTVTWQIDNPTNQKPSFTIDVYKDGVPNPTKTTSDTSMTFNAIEGAQYQITITTADNKSSKTDIISIPKAKQEPTPVPEPEPAPIDTE